jgi:flagellar M-ring protein FliF
VAAGVAGAASNAPNVQALPVYPKQTSAPQSAKTESDTYGVSKTVRHVVTASGGLRRMTVAVVVNDRLMQPAEGKHAAVWQARSGDELRNLTALAQAAAGFDTARGDVLTVQDLAFAGNRPEPPAAVPERVLEAVDSSPMLIKYTALLIGLLVVLTLAVRPAIRRAGEALALHGPVRTARNLAAAATAGLSPPPQPEADPERQRTQQIYEQVTDHLKREPTQSSRLLQSWIHSE